MSVSAKAINFFKLRSLYDLLLTLHPHASHSESSLLLWDIVRETVECLIARLESLDSANIVEADLIKRYGEIGDNLHFYLSFLEAGEANRIPSVMISPLQAMIRELAADAKVVVWCGWLPSNYSAGPNLGSRLRMLVTEVFDDAAHPTVGKIPSVLAVLSFPAAERDNMLLHSALGHELGHVLSVYNADIKVYTDSVPVTLDEEALRSIAKQIQEDGPDPGLNANLFVQSTYDALKTEATRILSNWLSELLADAYSVYLLGPAPLLSLDYLAGIQGPSLTHPPSHLRFSIMLKCLDLSGFRKANDSELAWLTKKLTDIETVCSLNPQFDRPSSEIVYRCLKTHLDTISTYIMCGILPATPGKPDMEPISRQPYRYEDWRATYLAVNSDTGTKSCLVDRMLNYVIPDCIDVPGRERMATLPSILNAGWAVFYGHWERFCKGLGATDLRQQHEARQKLFNLLLKGVEAVDLKRRWKRVDDDT